MPLRPARIELRRLLVGMTTLGGSMSNRRSRADVGNHQERCSHDDSGASAQESENNAASAAAAPSGGAFRLRGH